MIYNRKKIDSKTFQGNLLFLYGDDVAERTLPLGKKEIELVKSRRAEKRDFLLVFDRLPYRLYLLSFDSEKAAPECQEKLRCSAMQLLKRIEEDRVATLAVTGEGVLRLLDEQRSLLEEAAAVLKAGNIREVPARASSVAAQVRSLEQEIGKMRDRESAGVVRDIEGRGQALGDITFFAAQIGNTDADALRNMAASLRDSRPGAVALIIASDGSKATLCVASSKEAVAKGLKAGLLARTAAQAMGGNGGGKDDLAMAGGKQPEKAEDAFAAVRAEIEKHI